MDAAMIQAARSGDATARARVLAELQDPWFRVCLSLLGRRDLAREATQEAAMRCLRQLPGFAGQSQLRTWAIGIAINVCREMRRKGPAISRPLLIEPAQRPDVRAETVERQLWLRQLIEALPARQREAIVLRFFEDLSLEETAQAMSCALGTVKATLHQALRALRQRIPEPIEERV